MAFKDFEKETAAAENDRARTGRLVTTKHREVEENTSANPKCTTDEQDPMNAIEIELVNDVTNDISNGPRTSADSVTTVSGDASYVFEIDEHELEQDGFVFHELESQKDEFLNDLNPFCVDLDTLGKVACCFADTILDDESIDSLPIMEGHVDFPENSYMPEDKPNGRFLFMHKSYSFNQDDDNGIVNENGGNNKGIVNDKDGTDRSYKHSIGSRNRREDNTIVYSGGSDTNISIKEKSSTTDDESLFSDIVIFEKLNSDVCEPKVMPSEGKDGPQESNTERTSEKNSKSGKINFETWSNETEADTESLVTVEVEIGNVIEPKAAPVVSARKCRQEKSLHKKKNKVRNGTCKTGLKKISKQTAMPSETSIASKVTNGKKTEGTKRKFELWRHQKENSPKKAGNGSGGSGLEMVLNNLAVVDEMLPAREGGNADSGNAEFGIMQILESTLLPKKEDASYIPSLRIDNAEKGARPDMSVQSMRTEDSCQPDDEPETSRLADILLPDDLSLTFEDNALLTWGGGDTKSSKHDKPPATHDECLLPTTVSRERLGTDLSALKAMLSTSEVVLMKNSKKRTSVAKDESGGKILEKSSNETVLDTETLVAVEVEIGDVIEPEAVTIAPARQCRREKSHHKRKNARNETMKTGFEEVSGQKAMPSELLITSKVANGKSVEIGNIGEPKTGETKRKIELWRHRKEKSQKKAENESGKSGLGTVSNESADAIEVVVAAQGENGQSGNAKSGMMRMLENALLPKKEGASYMPSLKIANAEKDARLDMCEWSMSTEDASETEDEAESFRPVDVVLADDLSLTFESNALLSVSGVDIVDLTEPTKAESNRRSKLWKRQKPRKQKAKRKSGTISLKDSSEGTMVADERKLATNNASSLSESRRSFQLVAANAEILRVQESNVNWSAAFMESIGVLKRVLFAESDESQHRSHEDTLSVSNVPASIGKQKDVRQDMSVGSVRVDNTCETNNECEASKFADVVLPDDLSLGFDSNALLNVGGGDANAVHGERVLPSAATRERLNSDLGKGREVPSESQVELDKSFTKLRRVAKNENDKVELEKEPNETEVDAQTLVAVEVEIGDLVEPKAVSIPSRKKFGLKKSLKDRKVKAKSECGKTGLENLLKEKDMTANEESVEIVDVNEPNMLESRRKSKLWERQETRKHPAQRKKGTICLKKPSEEIKAVSATKLATENASALSESRSSFERASVNAEPLRVQESNVNWSTAYLESVRMLQSVLLLEPDEASQHPSHDDSLHVSNAPVAVRKQKDVRPDMSVGGVSAKNACETIDANAEPLRVQERNVNWSTAFLESMRMLQSVLLLEPDEASQHPSHEDSLHVSNAPVAVRKQKDVRPDMSVGGVRAKDACGTIDEGKVSKFTDIVLADDLSLIFEKPVWKATVDPSTGLPYFYHRLTRVATWTAPPDFIKQ